MGISKRKRKRVGMRSGISASSQRSVLSDQPELGPFSSFSSAEHSRVEWGAALRAARLFEAYQSVAAICAAGQASLTATPPLQNQPCGRRAKETPGEHVHGCKSQKYWR